MELGVPKSFKVNIIDKINDIKIDEKEEQVIEKSFIEIYSGTVKKYKREPYIKVWITFIITPWSFSENKLELVDDEFRAIVKSISRTYKFYLPYMRNKNPEEININPLSEIICNCIKKYSIEGIENIFLARSSIIENFFNDIHNMFQHCKIIYLSESLNPFPFTKVLHIPKQFFSF